MELVPWSAPIATGDSLQRRGWRLRHRALRRRMRKVPTGLCAFWERTGLAHILRAAVSLASETLRVNDKCSVGAIVFSCGEYSAGRALRCAECKKARRIGPFFYSGGADGTRPHPAGRGFACKRNPSSPAALSAGRALRCAKRKRPRWGLFRYLGGADGTRPHPAGRGFACKRSPSSPAALSAGRALRCAECKKARRIGPFFYSGGADGTRTRDPRRDRPVF